ncbi:putative phosphoglycolate phosphatase [Lupinus albus]|uniref:Putative phosphoglycolate phosphatase n=1 Tax=Lupinus albus TaxID=3870 RepID=A0A6A4R8P8_LUPAL|nr:putative phosphoglycolate phosphatase [Lupinus albus]
MEIDDSDEPKNDDDGGKRIELKPGFLIDHDEDVGAVIVGFHRYFNYFKVQ